MYVYLSQQEEDKKDSNDLSLIPFREEENCHSKLFRSYVLLERLSPREIQNLL